METFEMKCVRGKSNCTDQVKGPLLEEEQCVQGLSDRASMPCARDKKVRVAGV
jgi:hypothetical protein